MRLLLVLALLVGEIWIMLALAEAFGAGPVFLWLLGSAALGVYAIRRQGLRVVHQVRAAQAAGELPALPLLDALLGFAVGVLLILPGALSDVAALLLLASGLRKRLARRMQGTMARARPDLRPAQDPVTLEGEYRRR